MFRRRPIRRMLRQERRGRRASQELVQANQMMESGDYLGAAEQFEARSSTCKQDAPASWPDKTRPVWPN